MSAIIEEEPKQIQLSYRAILLFLFLFFTTLGVQAGRLAGTAYATGAFLACGLALLYVFLKPSGFFARFSGTALVLLPVLGLTVVLASAVYAAEIAPMVKATLLGLTFFVVASRIPSLSRSEFLMGLLLFGFADFLFLVVTRTEWNANTFCNHVVYASICGAGASIAIRSPFSRWYHFLWLAAGLACTFVLGSRTAVVGLFICLSLYWAFQSGKLNRLVLVFILVAGAFCAIVWSGDISGGLGELAKRNLGSQNLIAKFFLSDKSKQKIDDDFFDRKHIWKVAYTTMADNPVLGIGYDEPLPRLGGIRAHNAYLEIGYQCGVFAMLVWSCFYLGLVNFSSERIRLREFGSDRVHCLYQ